MVQYTRTIIIQGTACRIIPNETPFLTSAVRLYAFYFKYYEYIYIRASALPHYCFYSKTWKHISPYAKQGNALNLLKFRAYTDSVSGTKNTGDPLEFYRTISRQGICQTGSLDIQSVSITFWVRQSYRTTIDRLII